MSKYPKPKGYTTMALSGLTLNTILIVFIGWYLSQEGLTSGDYFIFILSIPLAIASLIASIDLLRRNPKGLQLARICIGTSLALEIFDVIFTISTYEPGDQIYSVIVIVVILLIFLYWNKEEHYNYLNFIEVNENKTSGATQNIFCRNCGKSSPTTAKFCRNCGKELF